MRPSPRMMPESILKSFSAERKVSAFSTEESLTARTMVCGCARSVRGSSKKGCSGFRKNCILRRCAPPWRSLVLQSLPAPSGSAYCSLRISTTAIPSTSVTVPPHKESRALAWVVLRRACAQGMQAKSGSQLLHGLGPISLQRGSLLRLGLVQMQQRRCSWLRLSGNPGLLCLRSCCFILQPESAYVRHTYLMARERTWSLFSVFC
jgi:hypothetical protein